MVDDGKTIGQDKEGKLHDVTPLLAMQALKEMKAMVATVWLIKKPVNLPEGSSYGATDYQVPGKKARVATFKELIPGRDGPNMNKKFKAVELMDKPIMEEQDPMYRSQEGAMEVQDRVQHGYQQQGRGEESIVTGQRRHCFGH